MGTPKKVLVVDDDDDLREAIGATLEGCGYEISFASNGLEALDVLAHGRTDLILLDMRMPVMDGWEFAKQLGNLDGDRAPIIVVTAAADARRCAHDIGAEGWMAKPFDLDTLINQVQLFVLPPD